MQADECASEEFEDSDALVQDSVNTQLISKLKSLIGPYSKKNWKTFVNFKLLHFNKKHSQEGTETSALVATIDLFRKTD